METINSFKRYGKVDDLEEAAFRTKLRRRRIILSISILVLLALVVGVLAGTLSNRSSGAPAASSSTFSGSMVLRDICNLTQYPASCLSSLTSANSTDPLSIFQFSLTVAKDSLEKLSTFPEEYIHIMDDQMAKEALKVCESVLTDAISSLNDTIAAVHKRVVKIGDLRTWLSTVVTDQETCIEAVSEVNSTLSGEIQRLMKNSTEFASNSLAIVTKARDIIGIPLQKRRLLQEAHVSGFPKWFTAGERRLLQERAPTPNVTVAVDGTGDVKTINEAVLMIPKNSESRFVIYVKKGEYVEDVALDKSCWNVMIYGDGKGTTIISGSKNKKDGTPTFRTAPFTVTGRGFIARDMSFVNTAGGIKEQAVAFRSGSDKSVVFRCSFEGFQDTLYTHSNRQFYRECDITGTVDFIFGNAAVVFQNCNIEPRQPLPRQLVTITAQSKSDINQNTGISIQRCSIRARGVGVTAPTYLGRPWKDYSTTIVMETDIGGFLHPKGWIAWNATQDPPADTILYAEYRNTGPGSSTDNRVTWAGYKSGLTEAEAAEYSVESFIEGTTWLPGTGMEFDPY